MIWCNANRYLPWLWKLFLVDHVVALSTQSQVSVSALSLPSLWMFISPDLMLLLGKTKSHVNLYLVITLVDTRCLWKFKQESHAQSSSLVNLCFSCAMSLPWTTPCWLLTLWLPLLAIPPCMVLAPMQPNLCHVRILVGCMFSNGGTISDLWCDETESPCGCTHKAVLLGMRWY